VKERDGGPSQKRFGKGGQKGIKHFHQMQTTERGNVVAEDRITQGEQPCPMNKDLCERGEGKGGAKKNRTWKREGVVSEFVPATRQRGFDPLPAR